VVALHDVNHDEMVLIEPDAMLRLSNAFIAWANGVSPELIGDGAKGSAAQACQQNR
jgi:hypothetical protein